MRRALVFSTALLVIVLAAFSFGGPTIAQGDDPEGTIAAMQATIDFQATKIVQLRKQVDKYKPTEEASEDKPEKGERCEDVSQTVQDNIQIGILAETGVILTNFQAVRSEDFEKIWMVAALMEGPGMDGDIGVWATNKIDDTGIILAVDGLAQEFSEWPDGDSTDAEMSAADDGVDEAKDCVEAISGS